MRCKLTCLMWKRPINHGSHDWLRSALSLSSRFPPFLHFVCCLQCNLTTGLAPSTLCQQHVSHFEVWLMIRDVQRVLENHDCPWKKNPACSTISSAQKGSMLSMIDYLWQEHSRWNQYNPLDIFFGRKRTQSHSLSMSIHLLSALPEIWHLSESQRCVIKIPQFVAISFICLLEGIRATFCVTVTSSCTWT